MEIKSTVVVVPGFSTGFYQESRVRLYPGMLRKVNCLRDAEGEIIEGVRVAQWPKRRIPPGNHHNSTTNDKRDVYISTIQWFKLLVLTQRKDANVWTYDFFHQQTVYHSFGSNCARPSTPTDNQNTILPCSQRSINGVAKWYFFFSSDIISRNDQSASRHLWCLLTSKCLMKAKTKCVISVQDSPNLFLGIMWGTVVPKHCLDFFTFIFSVEKYRLLRSSLWRIRIIIFLVNFCWMRVDESTCWHLPGDWGSWRCPHFPPRNGWSGDS